jgi:hypothetical protein
VHATEVGEVERPSALVQAAVVVVVVVVVPIASAQLLFAEVTVGVPAAALAAEVPMCTRLGRVQRELLV